MAQPPTIVRVASLVVAGVVAVSSSFLASAPAGAEEPPGALGAPILDPNTRGYAHLRVTATANSGWAVATFAGLEIIDHVVTSGAPVTVSPTTFSYSMGLTPRTVVLELLVSAPVAEGIRLTTTKGNAGSFSIDVDAVTKSGTVKDAFNVVNTQVTASANNAMTSQIPRRPLLAGSVDVGPIDDEPLVMTMVHPWWKGTEYGSISPDQPVDPWRFDSLADAEGAVDQMVGAGIDVALYSFGWPTYATDPLVDNLLAAADNVGDIRVAPVIEMTASMGPQGTVDLNYLVGVIDAVLADSAARPGLFLERDGRPVMFFYADWLLDRARWNELMNVFAGRGQELFPVTSVEDANRQTEGYWQYIGPKNLDETKYTNYSRGQTFRARLRAALRPTEERRIVVGTVWPGYDDLNLLRNLHRQEDRAGGAFFDSRWRAAMRALPDWVLVTSWNEWWEQTHVAPSTTSGTTALDQTALWAERFHDL